jgi:Protein of unknown function (DUF3313)
MVIPNEQQRAIGCYYQGKQSMWQRIQLMRSFMLMAVILIGCKAAPAPSVGFADPSVMKNDPTVPYNKFWRKSGLDLKKYNKIYVAEVNTSYMLKATDWQEGERRTEIEHDVQMLAVYARSSIMKAFRDDPNHRLQVIDKPTRDPDALVCEVALVEIVPSKVVLNALGYAPFYVGTGITVVRTIANDKSTVAFEARTRDAATGEIVMLAADREAEQYAPFDFRGLTWYGDADGIIDDWSKQFVQIVNAKPGQKVEGSSTFRLLPW